MLSFAATSIDLMLRTSRGARRGSMDIAADNPSKHVSPPATRSPTGHTIAPDTFFRQAD